MPRVDFAFLMLLNMKSGLRSWAIERTAADCPTKARYGCRAIDDFVM